jgi:hypothetical protein
MALDLGVGYIHTVRWAAHESGGLKSLRRSDEGWNYLYLSQKLAEIDDPVKREEFLKAVAHGSAAAWEHINLLGEYDLSEEKFKDSIGIKPPKLTD